MSASAGPKTGPTDSSAAARSIAPLTSSGASSTTVDADAPSSKKAKKEKKKEKKEKKKEQEDAKPTEVNAVGQDAAGLVILFNSLTFIVFC